MAWTERYVRADAAGSGDGTTDTNSGANGAWTLAEAAAAATAGQRVNVKAGTYTLSGSLSLANSGDATNAIWWRGFNSTIGDLDDVDVSTNFPLIDGTGGSYFVAIDGPSHWMSNLAIRVACTTANRAAVYCWNPGFRAWNCKFEGTASNANSGAMYFGNVSGGSLDRCLLIGSSSATNVIRNGTGHVDVSNCIVRGGINGYVSNGGGILRKNVFHTLSGDGVSITSANVMGIIAGNSFYSIGGDGVEFTNAAGTGVIENNIFSTVTGYMVNCSGGTLSRVRVANNVYHSLTAGVLSGVYQSQAVDNISDSSSPFVNAAGGDFTPASLAVAAARPSAFLDQSLSSYGDVGAVQKQAASGGGLLTHPGMSGRVNG